MKGFDGAGSKDFPLAAGKVTGYRWWCLAAPNFNLDPLAADDHWEPGLLRGQQGVPWRPGEFEATCLCDPLHRPPEQHNGCGCGVWAYWEPPTQPHYTIDSLAVLGVAEGYGRVLIGPKGFRCQKARIVALHLAASFEITVPASSDWAGSWRDAFTKPGVHHPEPGRPPRVNGPTKVPDQIVEETNLRIETWKAVIEDRLERMYPGAQVLSERNAFLRKYPVSKEYDPPRYPGGFPGQAGG